MSDVIATVNGTPIDSKALGAAMQGLAQEQFHATLAEVPEENHAELREMALERLVARELIYQAALAEGFVASKEVLRLHGTRDSGLARMCARTYDNVPGQATSLACRRWWQGAQRRSSSSRMVWPVSL